MADFKKPLYLLKNGDIEMFIDYDAFIEANKEALDQTTRMKIATMDIGDEMLFGGGTAGITTLKRIA
jgi:hypothetical protein